MPESFFLRLFRAFFAAVGAAYDTLIPPRIINSPSACVPELNTTAIGDVRLTNVHQPDRCAGEVCVVHNPSDHHMADWDLHWRNDRGIFERICPHGVGHPDPDQFAYWDRARAAWRPPIAADAIDDPYPPSNPFDGIGIHGCDGCCSISAASVTAAGPAEVSADQTPAPSVGHPVHHLVAGNTPTPVRSANSVQSEAGVGPTSSAGPPAAVDDSAGVLPPSPAGSPTADEWRGLLGRPKAVPAEMSARSDCDAALPAGHDPSDVITALCNQVECWRNDADMSPVRREYLGELVAEARALATHFAKSEAAARIVSRLHAAARSFASQTATPQDKQ